MNVFTKQRDSTAIMLVLAPLVFLTWGYFAFFGESSPAPVNKSYAPDEIGLHIQAQQFVLQGLKAPSTAKFPALPYDTSTDGDGLYKVNSYVDSQNGFGAMIRSDWTVLMRLSGSSWTLERMVIGGEVVYDPELAEKNRKKYEASKAEIDRLNSEIDRQLEYGRSLTQ